MTALIDFPQALRPVAEAIRAHEGELRKLGVTSLLVFGSRARGDERADSDLDVMIDYQAGAFTVLDLVSVQHLIEDATGLAAHVTTSDAFAPDRRQRLAGESIKIF